jgi:transcription elongation factor GreB
MSKAFLRESDFADLPDLPPPASLLPPGAKNYMTAGGVRELRAELERLREHTRPPLAAVASTDPEAKQYLNRIDQRIRYLQESLRNAEVLPPPADAQVVQFGATVTVLDSSQKKSRYRIVGVDETNFDRGWVSWTSPIARALLTRRNGDSVSFTSPSGVQRLQILEVSYDYEE